MTVIVNLKRYPITDQSTDKYKTLIQQYRNALQAEQYCALPEFINTPSLHTMLAEVAALRPQAYANHSHRNCYLQQHADSELSTHLYESHISMSMNPEHLEKIETKIAYQEQTIEELNQIVYQQSLQIAQLQETCRLLQQRFAGLSEMVKHPDSGDEKPPHY